MTQSERLQWQFFILLLVALIASIYYFSGPSKDNPTVLNARKNVARSNPNMEDSLPELSMLQHQLPKFTDVKLNVFKFTDASEKSADQTTVAETETMPLIETEPVASTGPDVTYLGFYHERQGEERKLAAISNGGQIYVGSEGETLAGKYKVLRVDDEFIDIEYLPENRIIHLKIGRNGNAPTQ